MPLPAPDAPLTQRCGGCASSILLLRSRARQENADITQTPGVHAGLLVQTVPTLSGVDESFFFILCGSFCVERVATYVD